MGNGSNRNRRGGSRTRHGPHRGGAASNDRRSATQLIPPVRVVGAEANPTAGMEDAAEESAEESAEDIAEQPTASGEASATGADTVEDDLRGQDRAESPGAVSSPTLAGAQVEPPADLTVSATGQTPASPGERPDVNASEVKEAPEAERRPARGHFERFYAPGQSARTEHGGHGGPVTTGTNGTNGANGANGTNGTNGTSGAHGAAPGNGASGVSAAGRSPARESHLPHAPSQPSSHAAPHPPLTAHVEEDDDETEAPSGPREDVRGVVGSLIDSLHELFSQDRTVASQGSVARCGICYLHFSLSELIYREAEGFYVCQSCARALGVGRIAMVRRQQRQ